MNKREWIVLNYNLPTEPSRHRVAVWRGLKKAGALNIQQSMWILLFHENNLETMQEIAREVEANNGEALLMKTSFFDEKHEERVISLFNNIRNEEYDEFLNECRKYIQEIKKEILIKKFSFAELEEEEEEFKRLESWYKKIDERDTFQAEKGAAAKQKLEETRKAIEEFSELVFKNNDGS